MISPLAYIHPEAKIGENVEIGPFVYIDKNVVIGDNNKIMPNANILYGSRIGNGNTISQVPLSVLFHKISNFVEKKVLPKSETITSFARM